MAILPLTHDAAPISARVRLMSHARRRVHSIDFPEFLQKLWIAVVEAHDLAELGAITRFVLDNLAPNLDLSKQQYSARVVAILFLSLDSVSEGINAMCLHITGCWFVGEPDITSHMDAIEKVIAAPKLSAEVSPAKHDMQ